MEPDTEYYTELATRTLHAVPPSHKPETINAPCGAQFACVTRILLLWYYSDPLLVIPTALRPFDSLYGTILDDLDMFVVMPNTNMVMPHPPLGNREVYMHENYQYGFDDPLQWPQAFVPDYPHYACLRWCTPEVNDPLRPLYLGVTEYDWQEINDFAIITSLGRMRRSTFWRLQAGCKAIIETVAGIECSAVITTNMRSHIIILEHLLACLSGLPMLYQRMHLCHVETQRVACELHTLVQYMTLYKPLMEAPESNAPPMPVDNGLVGAFSNDATTMQSFFKAGIPVWRVISIKELPGVHVDKVCEFSNSPHPEEPSRLCLPTIFTGSSRDPAKYKKIHEFVTHSMCWVDPFALSSPIVKYRADMPLIKANTTKSRYSLYQKKQNIQSGASNRLQDFQHQLLPPIIEPWRLALLAVDTNPARCHSCGRPLPKNKKAIPQENQYTFPRPDIIATLNTEQKVHSYLISWLQLREWQTVLGMGFLCGDPASRTAAEKRQTEVCKMMDGFMEELPLRTDNAASSAFWCGKNYEALQQEECQEILWELAEVNFCCEFKALHRHATGSNEQNLPIMHCFPDGDHLPGQLDIGAANYGLGDPLWLRQAPYIFAMKKAMWTWEDMPPSLLSEVRTAGWTEKEFLLVEETVANYYCDTFWQYFWHAPVLPRQLMHQTSEDYVPEAWLQMTTSRSGVYVDVEELS
ncbi:hypothetical protein EDD18DRAFT_1349448 [Armillaria luteobubalina]|uniref:CxC1-like cysteine cluster associated with KDZ transposases domain-containing protein n=1 Tax=Armillaria luteobubalina TaxID=153913 RepID=A0AA39TSB6_9AGAR|nr:hypothetical protein EDD18DRAFT_1349448 [Armillaria luteobubalina]